MKSQLITNVGYQIDFERLYQTLEPVFHAESEYLGFIIVGILGAEAFPVNVLPYSVGVKNICGREADYSFPFKDLP